MCTCCCVMLAFVLGSVTPSAALYTCVSLFLSHISTYNFQLCVTCLTLQLYAGVFILHLTFFVCVQVSGITELENVSLLIGDATVSKELGKLNLSSGRCVLLCV